MCVVCIAVHVHSFGFSCHITAVNIKMTKLFCKKHNTKKPPNLVAVLRDQVLPFVLRDPLKGNCPASTATPEAPSERLFV